jgi:hypothetical protein
MSYNHDTATRPDWVYRFGQTAVPIATTFGVFVLIGVWGVLELLFTGTSAVQAIGETDLLGICILAGLATAIAAPVVLGLHAALRRRWSARRTWAGLTVLGGVIAPTALLAWLVLTASGSPGESVSTGTVDVLKTIAMVYGGAFSLTVFVLSGPALGIALRRRSLPSDRRTLLVVGLVLGALLAGPFAVGAVVVDDSGDEVDYEGPTWNTTDEDGWNDSDRGEMKEGDVVNESTENDSDSVTELTLGEARCSESLDGVRETPRFNHSAATNGTLADDLRVEYIDFGDDGRIYSIGKWNGSEVVEVAADGPAGKAYAVDYLGEVDVVMGDAPARLWIDAVNDDGEVVRYEMDLCPPPES